MALVARQWTRHHLRRGSNAADGRAQGPRFAHPGISARVYGVTAVHAVWFGRHDGKPSIDHPDLM
jgi:hypothetical protein